MLHGGVRPDALHTVQILTLPDTKSIPSSSCGPDLRYKIINMHETMSLVRHIRKLLCSNHGVGPGLGTVSNCRSATA